jgi:hypothetical protein
MVLVKLNLKKKKVIRFKKPSVLIGNFYFILAHKLLIQKPQKLAFVIFYKILK